jgi:hypothetical protein
MFLALRGHLRKHTVLHRSRFFSAQENVSRFLGPKIAAGAAHRGVPGGDGSEPPLGWLGRPLFGRHAKLLVGGFPVSGLTGAPAVFGEPTPGARLEGEAVLALEGEAVGARLGLRGGGTLVFLAGV